MTEQPRHHLTGQQMTTTTRVMSQVRQGEGYTLGEIEIFDNNGDGPPPFQGRLGNGGGPAQGPRTPSTR